MRLYGAHADGVIAQILADIAHHQIQIFQAPQYDEEDEETIAENEEIMVRNLEENSACR